MCECVCVYVCLIVCLYVSVSVCVGVCLGMCKGLCGNSRGGVVCADVLGGGVEDTVVAVVWEV